jgi:hypothetical protein
VAGENWDKDQIRTQRITEALLCPFGIEQGASQKALASYRLSLAVGTLTDADSPAGHKLRMHAYGVRAPDEKLTLPL